MTYKNCNCNPPSVISSIVGDRCHIDNDRGEWCAIINDNGVYLQTLIVPSSKEIADNQAHQEKMAQEQVENDVKENRIQYLKNKLQNEETLTLQELTELLKLTI